MTERIMSPDKLRSIYTLLPGDMVQWVTEQTGNPKTIIIADFEDDVAVGCMIALNSVLPPVSRYVYLLYSEGDVERCLEALKETASGLGAESIMMTVEKITDSVTGLGFELADYNVRLSL